jgi:hypothetical protein
VGLALGLMLKSFLCHGKKLFLLAFSQSKKRHTVGDKKYIFLVAVHSHFYYPAFKMKPMNFHCYKTETFYLARFFVKKFTLYNFLALTPKPHK